MSRRAPNPGTSLVKTCEDLLAVEHVPCFRMNSAAFVIPAQGASERRFVRAGQKGMADLLAFVPDRCTNEGCARAGYPTDPLWIECKYGSGRQTAEQKDFQRKVQSWGHTYLVVRDALDLAEWLRTNRVDVQL